MDLSATTNEPTGRERLDRLLERCIEREASDLHIGVGNPPFLRIQGVISRDCEGDTLNDNAMDEIVKVLIDGYDHTLLKTTGSFDGAVSSASGVRFRFNVFRRLGAYSIAFRRLEDRFRPLQELGIPESLYEICDMTDGLVIVAGPTGAGKSTTLATLIDRINCQREGHIITIEDPVELIHHSNKCLVNQRQIGLDASSFNDALVAALRQDPDVILVGEVRDLATIRTAISAAETGHLVLTTLHAGDCGSAIERLISVYPAEEQAGARRQLSMVLRSILSQHLLLSGGSESTIRAPSGKGNVRRLVAASEILFVNSAIANLIANGKSSQIYSAMETGARFGMQTLEYDLARLVSTGQISMATALAVTRRPSVLHDQTRLNNKNHTARFRK